MYSEMLARALLLTLVSAAVTAAADHPLCGQSEAPAPGQRIVGGNQTLPGQFPWVLSLQLDGLHMCGASIIDRQFALTAAHCFRDTGAMDPKRWQVVAAEYSLSRAEGGEVTIGVAEIYSHADFSSQTNEHDIAVLRLRSPLPEYSHSIRPMCLAEPEQQVEARQPVTVIGWGTEHYLTQESADRLKRVDLFVYNTTRCAKIYQRLVPGATVIPASMMCAGHPMGRRDACQGDSGGPLMEFQQQQRRWVQVGVVSWGAACGRPLLAGVYTNVGSYRHWIDRLVRENAGSALRFSGWIPAVTLMVLMSNSGSQ